MQEIIHAFGIDWRLIVIQIFNFLILLLGLWYFLYTPVLSMLEKRKETIEKGLTDAAEAARALHDADKEKSAVLSAAHAEASAVASRAKTHADEKTALLLKEAEEKRERLLADAKREGELTKERLYKESEAEIAKTALLAAEKILLGRSAEQHVGKERAA